MTIINLLYAIIFPIFLGCVPLSWLFPGRGVLPFYVRLALGWGIGTIMLTLSMSCLGILGIEYSVLKITLVWLPLILLGLFIARQKKLILIDAGSFGRIGGTSAVEKILITALLLKVFYVFYEALIKPVVAWDSWAYWILMAKIFFVERLATPAFASLTRGGTQPWHMPLLNTWIFLNLGNFNDVLSKVIYPIYFVSLLLIFYAFMRRKMERVLALLFSFLLTTLPLYFYHASISYADSIVAFYACAGFVLLWSYFDERKESFFILSLLFMMFSILVKKQGYLYFMSWSMIAMAFVFVTRPDIYGIQFNKYFKYLVSTIGILSIPVLYVFFMFMGAGRISLVPHIDRIPTILSIFFNKLFMMGNWNIAWFAFVLVAALLFYRFYRSSLVYLFSAIVLNLLLLILLFTFSSEEIYGWLVNGTVLNRYLVQFTPLIVFFIGIAYNSSNNEKIGDTGKASG